MPCKIISMKKMLFLKFLLICRIYLGHLGSNSLLKMVTSADQKLKTDKDLAKSKGAEWRDIIMLQLKKIILYIIIITKKVSSGDNNNWL